MVTPLMVSCINRHRRMERRKEVRRVVVRLHVTVPGVHSEHGPTVRHRGLGQVRQGPMDLLLDQRGPLVTRCGRLLTDLAKPLSTLWLHGDCVSSLSVIGLSRTFILIGSGAGGHGFLADICSSGAFHYRILNFFLLSGRGAVGLGLHDGFSLLQLSATRNTCSMGIF